MHTSTTDHDIKPWYRQYWPWLLILPPAGAVVGGIITIILAVQSPNALVVDDYYKQGLAINQRLQRSATAAQMSLTGLLRSDGRHIRLQMDGGMSVTEPALTLRLIHSTRAELDRDIVLQRMEPGVYGAPLETLHRGRWYLQVHPDDMSWEIRSEMMIDGPFQAYLN